MSVFSGFPPGRSRLTPLPESFFTELLPLVDDLSELKVILHVVWRLAQRRGYPPCLSQTSLLQDGLLVRSMACTGRSPEESIRAGLERAVARGALIAARAQQDGREETFYFVNSDKGRQALEQIRRGELQWPEAVFLPESGTGGAPNIFVLYEQNIGPLYPLIVEELKEAEEAYPPEWVEDAFREAVSQNKRRWSYVRAILERWAKEGRGELKDKPGDRRRYIEGKYSRYVKRQPKQE